ncbi:hypothetical protein [Bosea sp. ANAM02]|uniref:hypothetical protein n=1 Tax=Bosea sp. ANAM02 TaxID=2020412 RepID=UPI00140EC9E3|nr:hypothetical protein [Bosea sp. ANAM02]BCB22226.1 hypothetical protein OCUBac02_51200 [Bosea sp. ANAM02]
MDNVIDTQVGAPNKAIVGWLEAGTARKDTIEHIKDYAARFFVSPNTTWYATMPFMGGFLYEIHEGGVGQSYLPDIAKALAERRDPAWFRTGRRVYSVAMRDGLPALVLQPEKESLALIAAGNGQLVAKGKMQRLVRRGTGTLVVGSALFGIGATFLSIAWGIHAAASLFYAPTIRQLETDQLPHRSWSLVERVPAHLYVEALRFKDNQWTTSIKPIGGRAEPTPALPLPAVQTPTAVPNSPPPVVTPAQPAPLPIPAPISTTGVTR